MTTEKKETFQIESNWVEGVYPNTVVTVKCRHEKTYTGGDRLRQFIRFDLPWEVKSKIVPDGDWEKAELVTEICNRTYTKEITPPDTWGGEIIVDVVVRQREVILPKNVIPFSAERIAQNEAAAERQLKRNIEELVTMANDQAIITGWRIDYSYRDESHDSCLVVYVKRSQYGDNTVWGTYGIDPKTLGVVPLKGSCSTKSEITIPTGYVPTRSTINATLAEWRDRWGWEVWQDRELLPQTLKRFLEGK